MIVGSKVTSGTIRGIDNARNILGKLRELGYNEAGISCEGSATYTVNAYTGTDAADIEEARRDMERITGGPAEVQPWEID